MFGLFKRPTYDLLIEPERITLINGPVRVAIPIDGCVLFPQEQARELPERREAVA